MATMLEEANQTLQTICKTVCCVFLYVGISTYLRVILILLELYKESESQVGINLLMRKSKFKINIILFSKLSQHDRA